MPPVPSPSTLHQGHNAEIAKYFSSIDVDGSGKITTLEFEAFLRAQKMPTSFDYVRKLRDEIDSDSDGHISFPEFERFYKAREQQLRESFHLLSSDSKRAGKLNASSLRVSLNVLGIKASDAEIRNFIALLDKNKDGEVSFAEYREVLLMLPAQNPRALFDLFREAVVDYGASEHAKPTEVFQASVADSPTQAPAGADTKGSRAAPLLSKTSAVLVSGGIAGAASRTLTAPLDRLKTLMQSGGQSSVRPGLLNALRDMHAKSGFAGFYRGNGLNCLKIAPETSIKMLSFERLKQELSSTPGAITPTERFVAGGCAGAVSQIAVYPLEIVKTRIALGDKSMYSGAGDCFAKIMKSEGLQGVYKGLGTSVFGVVPFAGIDLMANSMLKEIASSYYESRKEEPGVVALLGCGMLSSTIAMSLTYPIGLVRTRLQASGMPGMTPYKGVGDCISTIARQEGWRGFFKGFVPNMMKVAPSAGLSYYTFDYLQKAFAGEAR